MKEFSPLTLLAMLAAAACLVYVIYNAAMGEEDRERRALIVSVGATVAIVIAFLLA